MPVTNVISSYIIGSLLVAVSVTLMMKWEIITAKFTDIPTLAVAQPGTAIFLMFFTFALGAGAHCMFTHFSKA